MLGFFAFCCNFLGELWQHGFISFWSEALEVFKKETLDINLLGKAVINKWSLTDRSVSDGACKGRE